MRIFGKFKKRPALQQPAQRRVLFVSHEATRTGAPKIILNLLKHFREHCDIQCESILHTGGHLAADFAAHSITDCLNAPKSACDELQKRVQQFVAREKNNQPILAVCNSMESRFISAELHELGIPIVSLLHELPSSYKESDYSDVYDHSKKIVFPAHAVRDATDAKYPIPIGKSTVLPQGLLDPEFGTRIETEQARQQIRNELGLPDNAFIVLGCGTLDLRKGIDHFTNIARQIIENNRSRVPIHFVWVGEGHRWAHSPYHYVKLDLGKSAAAAHVHFIGERPNVEPYFVGSDVFLLSSRVDPFPCVIHEAMAAGLPVITFDNNGGAPEAIDNGAGFVIPYADYHAASGVIQLLAGQPEMANGIRKRSKERVHARYQFNAYADKLIDLCESVIGQRIQIAAQPETRRIAA